IHQLFEEQVQRTPDATAVVFESEQLTYQQLNARANQLAHYLRRQGVGPESLVGICLERSIEMVVALLGILKAGGAYLPLDPNYPKERLAFMLADANVLQLLTKEELRETVPVSTTIIYIDRDWADISHEKTSSLSVEVTGDNLAYVIYTSGSIGKPKGVQVLHNGVVNFLISMNKQLGIGSQEKLLAVTTLSFDIAVLELFLPLITGGNVEIASREVVADGRLLMKQLAESQASMLQATPASWKMLIDAGWIGATDLKILCGGEALTEELMLKLIERSTTVFNMYGPTETTIWSMLKRIERSRVTIGRAIANTQIYVLDEKLQPVPIGVVGELYIGGDGLARGYLNQPGLTAERFIPNSYSKQLGKRLYRTGDLARYLADGEIECLGRIDQQVKVRGYRIELGEIEAVLLNHTDVRDTVVVAREDLPDSKQLVAYLIMEQNSSISISELRAYLKEKLPEYMLPSAFVMMECLPLTPNGKVNRRALPAPQLADTMIASEGYLAARSPIEEIVVEIWTSVLNIDPIGVNDNFFELGGHSLLATQLMSRVRDTLRIEIALRSLFEYPTVAGLAKKIETLNEEGLGLIAGSIDRVSRDQAIPLSFAQQRLWFLDQFEPGSAAYNIPGAVRMTGSLSVPALIQSINTVIGRHESLRTSFVISDGIPIQQITERLELPLPIVNLMGIGDAAAEASRLIEGEAARPFNLSIGPLLRVKLLYTRTDEYILLFTMHHIISDGWSMGVMVKEVAALYQTYLSGEPSPLTELSIQYADYAVWQRERLQGEVLEQQLHYWKHQLGSEQEALALPTDRPRPVVQSHRGGHYRFRLSEELTRGLKELSRQANVTMFMTLLSTLDVLLYRYTNQTSISVGTPIANRNRTEIEGLIGFFVNTLVMRVELSGKLSFAQLLERVREVALGAYTHQDVPFEKVVEELQIERDLSRSPLFQVMLVLQNAPMISIELPDLIFNTISIDGRTTKFDLSVMLTETDKGLMGNWRYNTDLFDETTVDRLARHFTRLLATVVENAELRLWELPLLSTLERQQLLVEWNDTFIGYGNAICLHQLFEAQVRQTPDAVAVVFEQDRLSYQELNTRANLLA
ncbi:MAG: amino acid adenylation domain-containing protein, partial [Acidobacteriota bacterium]